MILQRRLFCAASRPARKEDAAFRDNASRSDRRGFARAGPLLGRPDQFSGDIEIPGLRFDTVAGDAGNPLHEALPLRIIGGRRRNELDQIATASEEQAATATVIAGNLEEISRAS